MSSTKAVSYASHMDPVVGPFMLARDETPHNWRERGIMQAVLKPEDLPRVRKTAGRLADEALDAAAAQGRIEGSVSLGAMCRSASSVSTLGSRDWI